MSGASVWEVIFISLSHSTTLMGEWSTLEMSLGVALTSVLFTGLLRDAGHIE